MNKDPLKVMDSRPGSGATAARFQGYDYALSVAVSHYWRNRAHAIERRRKSANQVHSSR